MLQGKGWRPIDFNEGSPYSIMFGPDKCGSTNKVHFIFRLKDPHDQRFVEHHLAHPPLPTIDLHTHVYTAIVYPNNTLKVLVDGADAKVVDLLSDHDVAPPVVAPARIPDPDEKRPADWDDRETIPDPDATKPDDWAEEEPREIVDTDVEKPQVRSEILKRKRRDTETQTHSHRHERERALFCLNSVGYQLELCVAITCLLYIYIYKENNFFNPNNTSTLNMIFRVTDFQGLG